jgi:hypothetical protein
MGTVASRPARYVLFAHICTFPANTAAASRDTWDHSPDIEWSCSGLDDMGILPVGSVTPTGEVGKDLRWARIISSLHCEGRDGGHAHAGAFGPSQFER